MRRSYIVRDLYSMTPEYKNLFIRSLKNNLDNNPVLINKFPSQKLLESGRDLIVVGHPFQYQKWDTIEPVVRILLDNDYLIFTSIGGCAHQTAGTGYISSRLNITEEEFRTIYRRIDCSQYINNNATKIKKGCLW